MEFIDLSAESESEDFVQEASSVVSSAVSAAVETAVRREMRDDGKKHKSWVFTLNNYTEQQCVQVKAWEPDVSRMTVSKEVGESGTRHLQGAVTFKVGYRFSAIKKLMPTAHWAVMFAESAAFLYCAKADSELLICVDNRSQGRRSDLKEAIETLKKDGYKAVAKDHGSAFIRYHRGFKELERELDRGDGQWRPGMARRVVYIWGKPRTGKSRQVLGQYTSSKEIWKCPTLLQGGFFQGYNGQDTVIFDDIRGSTLAFGRLLNLLDRYPEEVPIKGGSEKWICSTIYLTSIYHWSKLYSGETLQGEPLEQLRGRIDEVRHFYALGEWHECDDPNCTKGKEQGQDFADYGI